MTVVPGTVQNAIRCGVFLYSGEIPRAFRLDGQNIEARICYNMTNAGNKYIELIPQALSEYLTISVPLNYIIST